MRKRREKMSSSTDSTEDAPRSSPAELGEPDPDHLPRVVPFVDGGGDVEPLVALEPDEPPPEDPGEDPRDLGLPDPRLAFEEQRAAHPKGEEHRGGEAPLRDVVALGKPRCRLVDGGGKGHVVSGIMRG